jgi:hypothetical protein
MAPNVLASSTGRRMTGSDTGVASAIVPERPIMAANAIGPSSQGTDDTMWSLTDKAPNPG